jgi:hypothetical protein
MKLALTLMRRLAKGTESGLTMRQVEERVEKCASLERAEDAAARARQKEIDDGAATERAAVRAVASTRVLSRDDEAAKVSEAPSPPAAGVGAALEETAQKKGTGEASVA